LLILVEAALKRHDTLLVAVAADMTDAMATVSDGVPSLCEMLIRYVSRHMCSTHNPVTGLQHLPAHIASSIIDHLLSEQLLRPKTLHAFVLW